MEHEESETAERRASFSVSVTLRFLCYLLFKYLRTLQKLMSEGGQAHFCSEDSAKMSQTPSVVVITLTCSVIVGQHSRERISGGRGGMPKMFQRLTQ